MLLTFTLPPIARPISELTLSAHFTPNPESLRSLLNPGRVPHPSRVFVFAARVGYPYLQWVPQVSPLRPGIPRISNISVILSERRESKDLRLSVLRVPHLRRVPVFAPKVG
jgi:hypothetical protein